MANLKKVKQGDPLRFGAGAYNAFVDAALAEQLRQSGTSRGGGPGAPRFGTLYVKNDSGADRDRFDILGLDSPLFTPTDNESEFLNNCSFSGLEPAAGHAGRFCVLQEPLGDGKIGLGLVLGLTPCRVQITGGDEFADVLAGDATQLLGGTGSARILWPTNVSGDGELAFVAIGAGEGAGLKLGKLDGALAYGGSATCSIWTGTPAAETDSGENVTAWCWLLNSGETIASASKVILALINGYWQVIAINCPAAGA